MYLPLMANWRWFSPSTDSKQFVSYFRI